MQTMERGLPRATAAQEVSVWAQTWLPALHTELFYELEKVPLFIGWDGVGSHLVSPQSGMQGCWSTEASVLGGVLK